MFALSSTNVIMTLLPDLDDAPSLFSLRVQLALAAAAGRAVIAQVLASEVCSCESAWDTELAIGTDQKVAAQILRRQIFDAPHISLSYASDVRSESVFELLRNASLGLSIGSLEQWLQAQGLRVYLQRLKTLLYFAPI